MTHTQKLHRAVGARVQSRRLKLGLTQQELAKKLRVSGAHVSYIERGERGVSLATLHRIARVLDTSVGRLVPMDV
ncbi:MAG: helix-turn-helix domain-containing protein [Myxococcales bacterium]|nr:helix-turn-helix domain-containing protein [Myxococcales bacterium]